MATVILPSIIEQPDELHSAIMEAARLALDAELPTIMGEIAQAGLIPSNRGTLNRAVVQAAQPAQVVGNRIEAKIFVAGEASGYADVMDKGRRPGRPMSFRFLMYGPGTDDWRSGWVNRKMRSAVVELAKKLQQEAVAKARAAGRKKRKKALKNYEPRAAFLLARAIARKIKREGIVGRRFLADRHAEIQDRCNVLVNRDIGDVIRRMGYGGAA